MKTVIILILFLLLLQNILSKVILKKKWYSLVPVQSHHSREVKDAETGQSIHIKAQEQEMVAHMLTSELTFTSFIGSRIQTQGTMQLLNYNSTKTFLGSTLILCNPH